jgi:hypothetical protein
VVQLLLLSGWLAERKMARRILVIDDEEVLAKNIKRYLDRCG